MSRARKSTTVILLVAAAIVAALLLGWLRCGWGRKGAAVDGPGSARPAAAPAPVGRCAVAIDAAGAITANGRATDLAGAVAACRAHREAELRVSGAAPFGRYDEVKAALEAAEIRCVTVE